MSFHTGTDTDTKMRRTIAAKQKNNPGTAGEAMVMMVVESQEGWGCVLANVGRGGEVNELGNSRNYAACMRRSKCGFMHV